MQVHLVHFTLGHRAFSVPPFNVGQIEKIADALETLPASKVPYVMLKIALQRAEPPLSSDDVDKIECRIDEIKTAVDAILVASGLRAKNTDPNE
jgi:hypothetical protein